MKQHANFIARRPLELQVTRPTPCPYLPGKTELRLAADISNHSDRHDQLARAGFRRVENWVYKPVCPDCGGCIPIRIAAAHDRETGLRPNRSQRRVQQRNRDLKRHILPNNPTLEHYELFQRYLLARHDDGQMAEMDSDSFAALIAASPIDTVVLEYRLDEELVAVMLVDIQSDGLSAVYSFYDPDITGRSLGTFMILDCAYLAAEMGFDFVYLGYYVETSRKMNYKARFRPAEMLIQGNWQPAG